MTNNKNLYKLVLLLIIIVSLVSCDSQTIKQGKNVAELQDSELSSNIELDDIGIQKQLDYLDEILKNNLKRDDIQELLDSEYHKHSVNEEGLFMPDAGLYSGIDTFIYNEHENLLNFNEGNSFYTFDIEYNTYQGTVIEVNENAIIIETEDGTIIEYDEEEMYFDQVILIKNLLETRKAGIMVSILYSRDNHISQASIFYVSGEENQINHVAYGTDGTKSIYTATKISNRYRN